MIRDVRTSIQNPQIYITTTNITSILQLKAGANSDYQITPQTNGKRFRARVRYSSRLHTSSAEVKQVSIYHLTTFSASDDRLPAPTKLVGSMLLASGEIPFAGSLALTIKLRRVACNGR